jgi:hypothetical protein
MAHPLTELLGLGSDSPVQVAGSWYPDPAGAAGAPLVLQQPPGDGAARLELTITPSTGGSCTPVNLVLCSSARLAELRVQHAQDREPQYLGTLRGVADAGSGRPAEAAAADTPSATHQRPLYRLRLELQGGFVLACLRLASLADKGSCLLQMVLDAAGLPTAMAGDSSSGGGDGGSAVSAGPDGSAGSNDGHAMSQLDELRLLLQHATGHGSGGGSDGDVKASALPLSLQLLQQKLEASPRGAGVAAAQALATAVAKGVLLEQQLQPAQRQQPSPLPPQPATSQGSQHHGSPGQPEPAFINPSPELQWLAQRMEAAVGAAEARLHVGLEALAQRLAALEARLGGGAGSL